METSDEIQDIEKLSNSVKVINTEKNKGNWTVRNLCFVKYFLISTI